MESLQQWGGGGHKSYLLIEGLCGILFLSFSGSGIDLDPRGGGGKNYVGSSLVHFPWVGGCPGLKERTEVPEGRGG